MRDVRDAVLSGASHSHSAAHRVRAALIVDGGLHVSSMCVLNNHDGCDERGSYAGGFPQMLFEPCACFCHPGGTWSHPHDR